MSMLIKQISITLLATTLAKAGGRKTDATFMAIYGGAYCASSFIQWIVPAFIKVNEWLDKVGAIFDKVGAVLPWVMKLMPF